MQNKAYGLTGNKTLRLIHFYFYFFLFSWGICVQAWQGSYEVAIHKLGNSMDSTFMFNSKMKSRRRFPWLLCGFLFFRGFLLLWIFGKGEAFEKQTPCPPSSPFKTDLCRQRREGLVQREGWLWRRWLKKKRTLQVLLLLRNSEVRAC